MTSRLFFGNVHYNCNIRDLEKFVDGYGRIIDVKLRKGFAFLNFDSITSAERVVKKLNGVKLFGRPVYITYARDYYSRSSPSRSPVRKYRSRSPSFGDENRRGKRSRDISIENNDYDRDYPKKRRFSESKYDDNRHEKKNHKKDDSKKRSIREETRRISDCEEKLKNHKYKDTRSTMLSLIERLRKKEALKNAEIEDGEIISDMEETCNKNRGSKSPVTISDDESSDTSSVSETDVSVIMLKPTKPDEIEKNDEDSNKDVNTVSHEKDTTDSEEMNAFASPPSSPALSVDC